MTTKPDVAVVSTYYPPELGGAEAAAERLAVFLVRRGHRVLVVTNRTSIDHPADEMLSGVHVVRTGPIGRRRAAGKWRALPAITREVIRRRDQFQVICCIDYRGVGLAALRAGRVTRVPVIFQAQTEGVLSGARISERLRRWGFKPGSPPERIATWPVRSLYGRADAFACISRAIEQEALDCGVARDRVHYIPNPIDAARFTPISPADRATQRAAFGVPGDAIVAVFVGRLSREKGVMELLRAWRTIAADNVRLVIIGPDMIGNAWDVGPEARAFAREHNLGDRVQFTGGLPTIDVARWLQIADIGVQPSHFESFGISAVEAMAAGLPIVVTDTGGSRDFARDDVNALVVPPKDDAALAAALQRLIVDADLRRRLGAEALATAQQFDQATVLEQFAQLIDRLAVQRR